MRRLVRLALFVAVSTIAVLFLVCSLWAVPRRRRFRYRARFQSAWGRIVGAILGLRVEVRGEVPPRGGLLIVCNHLGYLDVPLLAGLLPLSFVAKSEVAGWPWLGFMAKAAGTLFIDREHRRGATEFVAEASARLRSGENLLVFPEGTSSRGETVLPFRSAVFGSVEGTSGTVVVPVAIELREIDGREALRELRDLACWHGDMSFLPHFLRFAALRGASYEVTIGTPIPCAGRDRKALAGSAREEVLSLRAAATRRAAPAGIKREGRGPTHRQVFCGGRP